MISQEILEQILAVAKIEEVVGEYVSLTKTGDNYVGLCPFHNAESSTFFVSPRMGMYRCFGCKATGNVIKFVMEVEGCTQEEAVEKLAQKYHIEMPLTSPFSKAMQAAHDREVLQAVNDCALRIYKEQLWQSEEGNVALHYLTEVRGLDENIIKRFQLGYAPSKSILCQKLLEEGFQEKYLINDRYRDDNLGTGICCKTSNGMMYDKFHGRIIIPFFSNKGDVIGFAGRIINHREGFPKYINSPESPIFDKRNVVFGLFHAKSAIIRFDECILVEGQLDVLSLYQVGIENVVCTGGTSPSKSQLQAIKQLTNNLTIIFDGDAAGNHATSRVIDWALEERMNVRVVVMPEDTDPDEFVRGHIAQDVIDYIRANKLSFVQYKHKVLLERYGDDLDNRSSYHEPYCCVRKTETPDPKLQVPEVKLSVEEAAQIDYEEGEWIPF